MERAAGTRQAGMLKTACRLCSRKRRLGKRKLGIHGRSHQRRARFGFCILRGRSGSRRCG